MNSDRKPAPDSRNEDGAALMRLRNLGPVSAGWLRGAGIHSRADLESLGAVRAYQRVKDSGVNPGLNLLYALAGALSDTHWAKLPRSERARLVMEWEALVEARGCS